MRFSVRACTQNASFHRMRFSSPAQTWCRLTKKRILRPTTHGKVHSGIVASPKSAFCDPVHPTAHGKAHSAPDGSRKSALCTRQLTEKRILGSSLSRKSTLCASGVTKSRILDGRRDGKAHSDRAPHRKTHSACEQSRTLRFSVRVCTQNASFRRVRFSSSAQTWRRLT